jgi:hypothetical protein
VTANHVVDEFRRCRERHPATRLFLRNVDLTDWDDRFIGGNEECDVATFRVSDREFRAIDVRPLRAEPSSWPPPPPIVGCGVLFTGYPEVDRSVLNRKVVEFVQVSNGLVVASVEPDEIEVMIDPAFLVGSDGRPPPPTTKNLSGYSGAPLLVVSASFPDERFSLGGVIIRQMHASSEDQPTHVWARRCGCISSDGHVTKPRHVRDED